MENMDKRKLSAVKLIEVSEGLKLAAYKDGGGIPTIGIGTIEYPDGQPVKMGDITTSKKAYDYLNLYLGQKVYPAVDKLCQNIDVPDGVYASLCSIAYNLGAGVLTKESFIVPVKSKDWKALADTFRKYTKIRVGGELTFSQGLANRREREIKHFEIA